MNPDNKKLPQLIVLGVLMIGFIGYLSFQVMSSSHSSAPAVTKSKSAAAVPGRGGSAQPEDASVDAPETGSSSGPGYAEVRRDPFAPQKLPGAQTPENGKTPSAPTRASTMVKNPMGKVPPINLSPMNPFSQVSGVPGGANQPNGGLPSEHSPKFVVTGVIRGAQNVAIIRSGDKGHYIVKQGQLIDGCYKVLSVTNDGAVLAYKDRRIHLKLGGAKNAS